MKFSNDVILIAIVIILFIIGGMIAVAIGYFFGQRPRNLNRTFKKSPPEDDFVKEDFSQIRIRQGEYPMSKRNWLVISRNLILFLIVVLITGGGIYYYFLQSGIEGSIVEEKQADNPVGNPDEISATSPTSSNQSGKEEDTSKWENYTNTTYNFSLLHPKEFVINAIDDSGGTIRISPPKSASPWLQVEVQSNPDQLPSGAYASKFPPEGVVKQRANLVIAEISSVRLETEKESITYVANGPKVIVFKISSVNVPDNQSQDLANLKRIITTLKFK